MVYEGRTACEEGTAYLKRRKAAVRPGHKGGRNKGIQAVAGAEGLSGSLQQGGGGWTITGNISSGKERFIPHNRINPRVWRAAVYARLSDEDRDKSCSGQVSRSIENQIAGIQNYIAYLNQQARDTFPIEVEAVYADDDYTGMNFRREAFQKMMEQVQKKNVDCIVVKNLSRLGRHDGEMQRYLEEEFEQEKNQVRLIAIGDNYDSLYDTIDILIKIKILFNREYSENQHRNVCAGMSASQRQGKFIGAFAPYGYLKSPQNKHLLVTDPYAAEIVKKIFGQYLAGASPMEIAQELTGQGILNRYAYKRLHGSAYTCGKSKNLRDSAWTAENVRDVLKNEIYTGTMVQGKTVHKKLTDAKSVSVPQAQWIRVESTHEPIIDRATWESVQKQLKFCHSRGFHKKGSHKSSSHETAFLPYSFAGMVKCAECGRVMTCRRDFYVKKSGEETCYRSYRCKYCTGVSVPEELLRKVLQEEMHQLLLEYGKSVSRQDPPLRLQWEKKADCRTESISGAKAERNRSGLQVLNNRLLTLRDKWLDGFLTDEQYRIICGELEQKRNYLEEEQRFLCRERDRTSAVNIPEESDYQAAGESLSGEKVLCMVKEILVAPEKRLMLSFYFSEKRKEKSVRKMQKNVEHLL